MIGNPPFVRYQDFSGEARVRSRAAALRAGVPLTNLASSWAAFAVHSALFPRPGGRMGLVLPAELLSVNYAAEVRRFLLAARGLRSMPEQGKRSRSGSLTEAAAGMRTGALFVGLRAPCRTTPPPSTSRWRCCFAHMRWFDEPLHRIRSGIGAGSGGSRCVAR